MTQLALGGSEWTLLGGEQGEIAEWLRRTSCTSLSSTSGRPGSRPVPVLEVLEARRRVRSSSRVKLVVVGASRREGSKSAVLEAASVETFP